MKLPFVSRERFDDMREARDHERENAQQLRRELVELSRHYHALRQSGAEPPLPVAIPLATRDVVTEAILQISRGSKVLRKQLFEYATEQRAAGVDEAEIAKAILEGVPDAEGIPE